MNISRSMLFAAIGLTCSTSVANAGVDVTMWNLSTWLTQETTDGPITIREDIHDVLNPLNETRHTPLGASFTTAQYDYGWLRDIATGHFNTSFTHAIRAPEIRSISTGAIFILPSEDIRVTVSGLLNYTHTSGDLDSVDFSASLRNVNTGVYSFLELRKGGNLYFQPSAGTLSFQGDAILSAGNLYRMLYVLDTSNTGDLLPTGTLDASGFVNFAFEPIAPEPSTILILLIGLLSAPRRKRH